MTQYALYAALGGLGGLVVAFLVYQYVRRQSDGSQIMRDIAGLIETGAMAFLRREYSILLPFLLIVAGLLSAAVGYRTGLAYVRPGIADLEPERVVVDPVFLA